MSSCSVKTYNITLGKVYNGDKVCTKPVIELAGKKDLATNCETIDPKCGKFRIQVGPKDEKPCLKFIVSCEECDVCPPQVIEKCLCESTADCKECEICGESGFCEDLCPGCDGCENGQCYGCGECPDIDCVRSSDCKSGSGKESCGCPEDLLECVDCQECVSDNQCPSNQFCYHTQTVEGEECRFCKCLPPLVECNDKCVECCDNNDCDRCQVCEGGVCVPKPCGGGTCVALDDGRDICCDCLNSGHCPQNECCYLYSSEREDDPCGPPALTPPPDEECSSYCDCCPGFTRVNGVCKKQDCCLDEQCPECYTCENGVCVPIECPNGYICVPGEGCKPECDCDTRDCSQAGSSSSCADHPTQEDKCYCHDCSDGDCTQDSSSDECGPVSDRDACICQGDDCVPNPCNGQVCSQDSECALGCTCDNATGTCIPCSQFSCTEQGAAACGGANSRNCVCNDAGECVGDPDAGCADSLNISKLEGSCQLVGVWNSPQCCKCPNITVKVIPQINGDGTISYTYELYKGSSATTGNNLSNPNNDQIADTEEPTSGEFSVSLIDQVTTYQYDNNCVASASQSTVTNASGGGTQHSQANITDTTSNSSTYPEYADSNTGCPEPGATVQVLDNRVVQVKLQDVLSFNQEDGTGCTYGSVGEVLGTIPANQLDIAHEFTLKSDKCRPVYFLWKQDGATFRKVYVNDGSDFVGINEGLEPCKGVTLDVDCGCDRNANSDSNFCNPQNITIEQTDLCAKEFTVTIPPACALNAKENGVRAVGQVGSESINQAVTTGGSTINISLDQPATSGAVSLVCSSGAVLCTFSQDFTTPLLDFPTDVECAPSGIGESLGIVNIPSAEGFTIILQASTHDVGVAPGTDISGQSLTMTLEEGQSGSITVLIQSECGEDETRTINIPSAGRCRVTAVATDPCSCDNILPEEESPFCTYFLETITFTQEEGFPIENIEVQNFVGNLVAYNAQGELYSITTNDEWPEAQPTGTPGEYTIEFYHCGGFTVEFLVEDVLGITQQNYDCATLSCDCDLFSITTTASLTACSNDPFDQPALSFETSDGSAVSLEIIQGTTVLTAGNFPSVGTVNIPNIDESAGNTSVTVRATSLSGNGCEDQVTVPVSVLGLPSCLGRCGEQVNECGTIGCGERNVLTGCTDWSPGCEGPGTITQNRTCTYQVRNTSDEVCSTYTVPESRSIDCSAPPPPPPVAPPTTPPVAPPTTPPVAPPVSPPVAPPVAVVFGQCCTGATCDEVTSGACSSVGGIFTPGEDCINHDCGGGPTPPPVAPPVAVGGCSQDPAACSQSCFPQGSFCNDDDECECF